ncbi:MAG: 4Fe-4S dicluster domain-containing protein [Robiginitomaculum sp.]|nr:4Fe-4S dicluster domain-containing protein [Robiginitomaculum sp.]
MAIHEKSLIRPENLITHDNLVIDGIDVSGDWSTFIRTRVVTDYNEALEEEISALPGGELIHRCWQCGSCTNSCTVNAENPDFNPRYWIYLIRMGMEDELLRDKDIIWQCVSCNKCTSACPRDVVPEGVMKATAHWLELKGHTKPSNSTIFDEVFTEQVIQYGKIEDGEVLKDFLKKSGQPLMQDWIMQMIKNMIKGLPVIQLMKMGWATVFHPKTKDWSRASAAITEYVAEEHAAQKKALGLDDYKDAAE